MGGHGFVGYIRSTLGRCKRRRAVNRRAKKGKFAVADLFDHDPVAAERLMGARVHAGWLSRTQQEALVSDLRAVAAAAPLQRYETPGGHRMSVAMTAAGEVGWITDRRGYRYAGARPGGDAWPAIPEPILGIWRAISGVGRNPDSCLVNFYGEGARMGLHQDRDEADTRWPVVSVSLGDDALFRIGGLSRSDRTKSRWLKSGDIVVLEGTSRLAYHGIDRIRFGSSDLLPEGGRLNITLRVAQ